MKIYKITINDFNVKRILKNIPRDQMASEYDREIRELEEEEKNDIIEKPIKKEPKAYNICVHVGYITKQGHKDCDRYTFENVPRCDDEYIDKLVTDYFKFCHCHGRIYSGYKLNGYTVFSIDAIY
jgi:hypothetical protein